MTQWRHVFFSRFQVDVIFYKPSIRDPAKVFINITYNLLI